MLKTYRMISMAEMYTNNMGKYLEDYLHPRRNKPYSYAYGEDITIMDRECYQVYYSTEKETYNKKGILVIDKEDFGIHKNIMNGKNDFKEVSFTRKNHRYFLQSTIFIMPRAKYVQEKQIIYNIAERPEEIKYFPLVSISPKLIKVFKGDFDNDFWESFNYIPIPEWVKSQTEVSD